MILGFLEFWLKSGNLRLYGLQRNILLFLCLIMYCNNCLTGWLIFCTGDLGTICLLDYADRKLTLDLNINENPVDCDCRDYSVIALSRFFFVFSHRLDRLNCDAPLELYNQKVCVYVSRKKVFLRLGPFQKCKKILTTKSYKNSESPLSDAATAWIWVLSWTRPYIARKRKVDAITYVGDATLRHNTLDSCCFQSKLVLLYRLRYLCKTNCMDSGLLQNSLFKFLSAAIFYCIFTAAITCVVKYSCICVFPGGQRFSRSSGVQSDGTLSGKLFLR